MGPGDLLHFVTWPIRMVKRQTCPMCVCRRNNLNAAGWFRAPGLIWRMFFSRDFGALPPPLSGAAIHAMANQRGQLIAMIARGDSQMAQPKMVDPNHGIMIMMSRAIPLQNGLYQFGWADYDRLTGKSSD